MAGPTHTSHSVVEHANERGSALIAVLLLLMMMSALAAALSVSGQTETFISRNERSGAQAHAAAEAGLNHAVELAKAALDGGSTTNDLLVAGALGLDALHTITPGIKATYTATIEDDAGGPGEDGNPLSDVNGTVVVKAIGKGQDETEVTLEAMISGGGTSLPAFFVNGDVEIHNPFHVSGAAGDFHINGNLTGSANKLDVEGTATVSGVDLTNTTSETVITGAPSLAPVSVVPSDHRHFADFILTAAGTITNQAGNLICSAPCSGWTFTAGTPPTWNLGTAVADGTYYIEGKVKSTVSVGSAKVPKLLTLIAEKSIEFGNKVFLNPDTPELLLVTGGDLRTSNDFDLGDSDALFGGGQILVHEQWRASGKVYLTDSQVIIENWNGVGADNLATANNFTNDVNIVNNGALGGPGGGGVGGAFNVTGWWEVR